MRIRSARRVRRAPERGFATIVENAPVGVFVHRDGRLLYANGSWLRYVGAAQLEAVLGSDPLAAVAAQDREAFAERLARVGAGHDDSPAATELLRPDGTTVPVEAIAFQVAFDGGPAVAVLARDVAVDRDRQNRLLVADRLISIGTLVAGVAHELNNPLAYVHANIEAALERLPRGEADAGTVQYVREALAEAREGAARVRLIIRDLKTFSRDDDDERIDAVELTPVLESAINFAFHEIRHRARIVKTYGPAPMVAGSAARLGQVFLNLLVNAAQAIPEGAPERNEIRISTGTDELGRAVVAVADSGVGIPPEKRRRVFDPFFTTKPAAQGTGLGLTICQRIVTSLGGEIHVASDPGHGAEFRVVLPPAPLDGVAPPTGAREDEEDARRGRILVVDDDPLALRAIQRVLARHEVVAESSGHAALARLAAGERFDVVLCDLLMPGMSGMEMHDSLLETDHRHVAARIIFLTAGAFTPAARRFLERVPNLRLEKPFKAGDLRALVRSQLA